MSMQTQKQSDTVWLINTQARLLHLPDEVRQSQSESDIDRFHKLFSEVVDKSKMSAASREVMAMMVVRLLQQTNGALVIANGKSLVPSAGDTPDAAPKPTAIDRAYWEAIKGNREVQSWLRLGWIKVADDHAPGTDKPDTLMKYNQNTAIVLVEGERNTTLLQGWLVGEERDDVRNAITKRLSQLTAKLPALE
jgi:hypothetical protein